MADQRSSEALPALIKNDSDRIADPRRARLDPDGTAKGKTSLAEVRVVQDGPDGRTQVYGPANTYVADDGSHVPLAAEPRSNEARDAAIWAARKAGKLVEELGAEYGLRREKVVQICVVGHAREQQACEKRGCRSGAHEPPCPMSDPAELAILAAEPRSNEAPCVTPNGRTDGHGSYVERDSYGAIVCAFCKRSLDAPRLDALPDEKSDQAKYYVKARVYGAIAAEYQRALERIAAPGSTGVTIIAKDALAWRHSEEGGVPRAAVDEIGALLRPAQRTDYPRCDPECSYCSEWRDEQRSDSAKAAGGYDAAK